MSLHSGPLTQSPLPALERVRSVPIVLSRDGHVARASSVNKELSGDVLARTVEA